MSYNPFRRIGVPPTLPTLQPQGRLAAMPQAARPMAADARFYGAAPAPRVFLFHGADAGLSDNGKGGTNRLAARLQAEGFPEATALGYNTSSKLINLLAIVREQLFHTFSTELSNQIMDDLKRRPLAPGQKLNLVGYSLGCQVAARVAERLARVGIPVDTLALIEPKNGDTPPALSRLPLVNKVVLVENQVVPLQDAAGRTPLLYSVPHKTHMEMLETPDEGMVRFLLAQLR